MKYYCNICKEAYWSDNRAAECEATCLAESAPEAGLDEKPISVQIDLPHNIRIRISTEK